MDAILEAICCLATFVGLGLICVIGAVTVDKIGGIIRAHHRR